MWGISFPYFKLPHASSHILRSSIAGCTGRYHTHKVYLCLQLLATAMDTNDSRSIIRTLPQQTVVTLPADQDLLAASAEAQQPQQHLQSQLPEVRNASTTALLVQKLGGALPAGASSAQPGALLPVQGALPYGNVSAGGAFSLPAGSQQGNLTQSHAQGAAAGANGTAAGGVSGGVVRAAGALLPAQAWQAYPEHKPDAHNATGADLYTSKGAGGQQREAGLNVTRSACICSSMWPASADAQPLQVTPCHRNQGVLEQWPRAVYPLRFIP